MQLMEKIDWKEKNLKDMFKELSIDFLHILKLRKAHKMKKIIKN